MFDRSLAPNLAIVAQPFLSPSLPLPCTDSLPPRLRTTQHHTWNGPLEFELGGRIAGWVLRATIECTVQPPPPVTGLSLGQQFFFKQHEAQIEVSMREDYLLGSLTKREIGLSM